MYKTTDIYEMAIKKFGETHQLVKTNEELSELQKEICKYINGDMFTKRRDKIAEEIADVEIMIEQVKRMVKITDAEVHIIKEVKFARLEKLLNSPETCCSGQGTIDK